jgi:hypothetical protein
MGSTGEARRAGNQVFVTGDPGGALAKAAPLRKSPPICIFRKALCATTFPKPSPSLGQPIALTPPESPAPAAGCSCWALSERVTRGKVTHWSRLFALPKQTPCATASL